MSDKRVDDEHGHEHTEEDGPLMPFPPPREPHDDAEEHPEEG